MAATDPGAVLLISVHPRFAEEILSGRKRVEFRRKRPGRRLDYLVIYATAPQKVIVCFAEVKEVDKGKPIRIWQRYAKVSGIDRASFLKYCGDQPSACAISLGRVYSLRDPQPISFVDEAQTPPQGFRYVSADCIPRLRALSNVTARVRSA